MSLSVTLVGVQVEKDSPSLGELSTRNVTMLQWTYGQHKMDFVFLSFLGRQGRRVNMGGLEYEHD